MAPADRDAILARRAVLLGAALSGVALAPRAGAQAAAPHGSTSGEIDPAAEQGDPRVGRASEPEEPCGPARPPTREELDAAKEQHRVGASAFAAGELEPAQQAFRRAFELSGRSRVLGLVARVAAARGDFVEAKRLYRRVLTCGESNDLEIVEELAKVEARIAHVTLSSIPDAASVELDGKPIPNPRDRFEVNPGPHVLRAVRSDGRVLESRLELVSGEDVTIALGDFPPDCEAAPALCMPCLSPPPPPPAIRETHWGLEAGWALWLDTVRGDSSGRVGHGVRVVPYLAVPIERSVSLRLGVTGGATWTADGDFFPLGADAGVALGSAWWEMGLGVSGGWMLTGVERPKDELYAPRRGVFVEPYVQAISARLLEPLSVGLRVGPHFSSRINANDEVFGLSYLNVGVWVRVALSEDCGTWGEENLCEARGLLDGE